MNMVCAISYLFKVCLYIGISRIFTNLSVDYFVENGSEVCITTLRISQLVRYVFPIISMGSFMGTIALYH